MDARVKTKILEGIRKICREYPEVEEIESYGHPGWNAGKKAFAYFEDYRGHQCLVVKVDKGQQGGFLRDSRFFSAPYIGKYGWISLILDREVDWEEIRSLLDTSYKQVALKRMMTAMKR